MLDGCDIAFYHFKWEIHEPKRNRFYRVELGIAGAYFLPHHAPSFRYATATPKRWSELVSKQFSAVIEGLESETPDRKKWMQLIRDMCQFLHDLSSK